jgi:hypothetical protein
VTGRAAASTEKRGKGRRRADLAASSAAPQQCIAVALGCTERCGGVLVVQVTQQVDRDPALRWVVGKRSQQRLIARWPIACSSACAAQPGARLRARLRSGRAIACGELDQHRPVTERSAFKRDGAASARARFAQASWINERAARWTSIVRHPPTTV